MEDRDKASKQKDADSTGVTHRSANGKRREIAGKSYDYLSFDEDKRKNQMSMINSEEEETSQQELENSQSDDNNDNQQGAYSLLADLSQPSQNIVQEHPQSINIIEKLIDQQSEQVLAR